jgi:hypothetical protein
MVDRQGTAESALVSPVAIIGWVGRHIQISGLRKPLAEPSYYQARSKSLRRMRRIVQCIMLNVVQAMPTTMTRISSQNLIGIGSLPSAPDQRQRAQDDGGNTDDGKPIGTMRPWQERFVIVGRRREAALVVPIEANAGQSDACAAMTRAYSQPQTATAEAIADAAP